VSIAQDNNPAAVAMKAPCCLISEGESRPTGYGNKHKIYAADRVRASTPNFAVDNNGRKTHNFYSRDKSFVQNNGEGNVENHLHQNHSDSPISEPLIKHTCEDLKISLTNPAITREQELKFRAIIYEFGDIFAMNNSELTGTDRLKFTINIQQDTRPIRLWPYSYFQEARVEIERQIQEMLAKKNYKTLYFSMGEQCFVSP